jgi:hypothetical protein
MSGKSQVDASMGRQLLRLCWNTPFLDISWTRDDVHSLMLTEIMPCDAISPSRTPASTRPAKTPAASTVPEILVRG